jgi:hypothetical protein
MKSENERTCGNCTACCDGWLQIEVLGYRVHRGNPCPFSVEHRCSIYSERPQHPCREFICGWLVFSSPLPDWMRPDKSDMIMLPANFMWHGLPVDVAVAAGDRPKQKALDWLMKFSSEKKRLLIYQAQEDWFAFVLRCDGGRRACRGIDIQVGDPVAGTMSNNRHLPSKAVFRYYRRRVEPKANSG